MRPPIQAHICRILICSVLVAFLWPSFAWSAKPRANKHVLLKRKANIQSKIGVVRQHLRQVKAKARQTRSELAHVENRLRIARGQLQIATLRYERSQIELHNAHTQLQEARSNYTDTQDSAGRRLVAMYERGEPGYLELVMSSNDFGDLLQRAQLAKLAMEEDQDTLRDLHQRKDKLTRYEGKVAQKTREVAVWKEEVAVVHERTAQQRTQVAKTLTEAQIEANDLEAELAALVRDSAEVTNMLQRLAASPEGHRRFNKVYPGPVGGLPVNGRITSPFGYRYHPILHIARLHTGVDIAAPAGTPIYAAGGGEVVSAGWRGGYGNAVVIDHGHGRATLYGHMKAIAVHQGEVVRGRQVIGFVGMTGLATGPHVHYEVRINGVPVNPLTH